MNITAEREETTYTIVCGTEELQMIAAVLGGCVGEHAVHKPTPTHRLAWRVYRGVMDALRKQGEDDMTTLHDMERTVRVK